MKNYLTWVLVLSGLLSNQFCLAQDKPQVQRNPLHQKVIDFEGDLVEGMNKRPLDSLSEISELQKRRKRMHLYRKRRGFRTETQETLREMRYLE